MSSFSSLIRDTLIPNTRVYHDANGNYAGSSTDITPALRLFGKIYGLAYLAYYILMPLLCPVYWLTVRWYCWKYDAEFTKLYPSEWPKRRKRLQIKYGLFMLIWIVWMSYGYNTNWGVDDYPPYPYTQPSANSKLPADYHWEPDPEVRDWYRDHKD